MKVVAVYLLVVGLIAVGWGMNFAKLVQLDFESPYKAEIIRAVGIVPIVGAITGYMTIGEENNE